MTNNRRDKTPILYRLKSEEQEEPFSKSPNIYTNDFQKQKTLKQSTSRGSLARKQYKKNLQNKSSSNHSDQNQRLNILLKQNTELRKEIVELKVHQFYQFDDKKLKQLLVEVQTLKKQLRKCKQQLEHSQIQNDFLRRTNSQIKSEIQRLRSQNQKQYDTKLYEKKYRQNAHKTLALSPRHNRDDQQLTQRIVQKAVISSSPKYDDFQDCRMLLESKSTTKKQKMRRLKQTQNEYLLRLQSKQKILQQLSPRNSSKPRLSTSPRDTNNLLVYKSRRNQYLREQGS